MQPGGDHAGHFMEGVRKGRALGAHFEVAAFVLYARGEGDVSPAAAEDNIECKITDALAQMDRPAEPGHQQFAVVRGQEHIASVERDHPIAPVAEWAAEFGSGPRGCAARSEAVSEPVLGSDIPLSIRVP